MSDDVTDQEIAQDVRQNVRTVKAGARSSSTRMKVDGLWVLVTVERSATQQEDAFTLFPNREHQSQETPSPELPADT